MTTPPKPQETPETDAAELDALVVDMPGQQTTDKVVRSIIARSLERRLRDALAECVSLRRESSAQHMIAIKQQYRAEAAERRPPISAEEVRDARRYQFLRNQSPSMGYWTATGEGLDAAVDNALAAAQEDVT